jgi:hypothetical protein
MKNEPEPTDPNRQYAAAYAAHYTGHDLPLALELYKNLISSHPGSQEAEFSRMQVENIVHSVVPTQELLDAHMALARTHFDRVGPLDGTPLPATQPVT